MQEQKQQIHDIVIIGGGVAGIISAIQADIYNLNSVIIESSNKLGGLLAREYSDITLNTIISNPIIAKDFVKQLEDKLNIHTTHVKLNTIAYELGPHEDISGFYVKINDETLLCKNVIICCGDGYYVPKAPPSVVGLQKAITDKRADLYIDDINKYNHKDVVILGANSEALIAAIVISEVADSVTIINNSSVYRASDDLLKKAGNNKIEFLNECEVFSISETINKLTLLRNNYTGYISFDKLLCFFGFRRDFTIMDKWKHVVNFENKNTEGIYIVGNCSVYLGKTDSINSILGEADSAIQQCYRRVYGSEAKTRYETIK